MVNFVSLFCPELQKLLKPFTTLLEKADSFYGRKNNNKPLMRSNIDFKDPQSYIYPTDMDVSNYSGTSKFSTGSTLYQIQNGQPRLIAYASKRMPEAAKNYSITELETCGLAMNITTFLHLLKKVDFDAIVNHLAITHIMRSKAEPATT